MNLSAGVTGTARLSDDGVYRYELTRSWAAGTLQAALDQRCLWVMLNPSTAAADVDDATIRKCIEFSRRWGYGGLVVVNLYALRATDPSELAGHPAPVGPANDAVITRWLASADVGRVVEAWGAHPMARDRAKVVHTVIRRYRRDVWCLGTTSGGAPRHPGRIGYDTPLERAEPG